MAVTVFVPDRQQEIDELIQQNLSVVMKLAKANSEIAQLKEKLDQYGIIVKELIETSYYTEDDELRLCIHCGVADYESHKSSCPIARWDDIKGD